MILPTTTFLLLVLAPQDTPKPASPEAGKSPTSVGAKAQALKTRIHKMRTSLLLGGDKVRQAEGEALKFYQEKIEKVEQGLDSLRADIEEKKAAYQISIDRVMQAADASARKTSMREAAGLRGQLNALKKDADTLQNQRASLSRLVSSVRGRDRDRKVLAAKLEASTAPDESAGIPLPAVGLAPTVEDESANPLLDDGLVADLLRRNRRKGRQVLYETDPVGYWIRFPLRPPAAVLFKALAFPVPDLPGRR